MTSTTVCAGADQLFGVPYGSTESVALVHALEKALKLAFLGGSEFGSSQASEGNDSLGGSGFGDPLSQLGQEAGQYGFGVSITHTVTETFATTVDGGSGGGAHTITLSDNTQVTFTNLSKTHLS